MTDMDHAVYICISRMDSSVASNIRSVSNEPRQRIKENNYISCDVLVVHNVSDNYQRAAKHLYDTSGRQI